MVERSKFMNKNVASSSRPLVLGISLHIQRDYEKYSKMKLEGVFVLSSHLF